MEVTDKQKQVKKEGEENWTRTNQNDGKYDNVKKK